MRVAGYLRVSTQEQGESGAGLEAQRQAIEAEAIRRGWERVCIFADVASGKSQNGRPQLEAALGAVERGELDALVVSKLDRLSRSVVDLGRLMERAKRKRWPIVILDLGVDTTTPNGKLVANVIASIAEWERDIIGARTKDALAVKKAQGVRLGRPRELEENVRRRIKRLRARGTSFPRIADRLNREEIPTAHGGRWWPTTVKRIVDAEAA